MARRGGTDRLGDVITGLLQKRGYGKPLALQAWRDAWLRAAGERLAARSRVAGWRDGTLTIEVPSSAQRYELEAFHATDLLARLRQDGSVGPVKKLVFRVGTVAP